MRLDPAQRRGRDEREIFRFVSFRSVSFRFVPFRSFGAAQPRQSVLRLADDSYCAIITVLRLVGGK